MRRMLLISALCLIASPARAGTLIGQLQFTGTVSPDNPGVVSFASDGTLAIAAPIDTVTEISGPNAGRSFSIANGALDFAFGKAFGPGPGGGFGYSAGGSASVVGAIPTGGSTDLVFGGEFFSTDDTSPIGGGLYHASAVNFEGFLSPGMIAAFDLPPAFEYTGEVSALFRGSPGGVNTLMGAELTVNFVYEAAVPEPASIAMTALGLACLALTRRRSRVKISTIERAI